MRKLRLNSADTDWLLANVLTAKIKVPDAQAIIDLID
jgi:hypothetical protein